MWNFKWRVSDNNLVINMFNHHPYDTYKLSLLSKIQRTVFLNFQWNEVGLAPGESGLEMSSGMLTSMCPNSTASITRHSLLQTDWIFLVQTGLSLELFFWSPSRPNLFCCYLAIELYRLTSSACPYTPYVYTKRLAAVTIIVTLCYSKNCYTHVHYVLMGLSLDFKTGFLDFRNCFHFKNSLNYIISCHRDHGK